VRLTQYFAEAFGVLAGNAVRSILTVTGLIIGVTAVIAIQVLGAGMSGAVSGILGGLSDQTFIVFPNQQQSDFTRAALRPSDLARATEIPNVVAMVPLVGQRVVASFGHVHPHVSLGPGLPERYAATTPIRFGRKYTPDDIAGARNVCILSDAAYTKLAISGDPIGQSLRVGDHRYTIVGVLGLDKAGILPLNFNLEVTIPYTAFERDFQHGHPIAFVRVLMDDASQVDQTEANTLNWLRGVKRGRVEYVTFDRKSFSSGVGSVFAVITVIVGLIGAVSLVVAGIGILNIMLVSVAERTREIGLRKAIGATSGQVLLQFFIEALALSGFGCLAGLVFGVTIGGLVNSLAIVKISGVVAPIPWVQSILIATIFTTVVTVLFGTYPAYRAARLDPIEALRYE
jgi:putative ABC transport system permease protein